MNEYETTGPASDSIRWIQPRSDPEDRPTLGRIRSTWLGALSGLRRASYIAGPIAILTLIPTLFLAALGLGAGRGWPIGTDLVIPLGLSGPFIFYCTFRENVYVMRPG